jgi:hypothetical protein
MEKETIKPSHVSPATTCYARSLKIPASKTPSASLVCPNLPARKIRNSGHTCAGICKSPCERGYCMSMFSQRAVRLPCTVIRVTSPNLSARQVVPGPFQTPVSTPTLHVTPPVKTTTTLVPTRVRSLEGSVTEGPFMIRKRFDDKSLWVTLTAHAQHIVPHEIPRRYQRLQQAVSQVLGP